MSALEPIQVRLSPFEKLQILRAEFEAKTEELQRHEALIRAQLYKLETQRYLESLDPFYAANPPADLPTKAEMDALSAQRQALANVVKTIEANLPAVVEATKNSPAETGQPAAAASGPAAGPARKIKFDSFDDFRKSGGS